MSRYGPRPVVIDAVLWSGDNYATEVVPLLTGMDHYVIRGSDVVIGRDFATRVSARVGDWIVKDVEGQFHVYEPAIFQATYEPADTPKETA